MTHWEEDEGHSEGRAVSPSGTGCSQRKGLKAGEAGGPRARAGPTGPDVRLLKQGDYEAGQGEAWLAPASVRGAGGQPGPESGQRRCRLGPGFRRAGWGKARRPARGQGCMRERGLGEGAWFPACGADVGTWSRGVVQTRPQGGCRGPGQGFEGTMAAPPCSGPPPPAFAFTAWVPCSLSPLQHGG